MKNDLKPVLEKLYNIDKTINGVFPVGTIIKIELDEFNYYDPPFDIDVLYGVIRFKYVVKIYVSAASPMLVDRAVAEDIAEEFVNFSEERAMRLFGWENDCIGEKVKVIDNKTKQLIYHYAYSSYNQMEYLLQRQNKT